MILVLHSQRPVTFSKEVLYGHDELCAALCAVK